jgi:hypothetical protein
VAKPPEHLLTARLKGGDLDGLVVEIQPGQDIIRMQPMITLGRPADRVEEMNRSAWEYRFASVDDTGAEPQAVFEFTARHREESPWGTDPLDRPT